MWAKTSKIAVEVKVGGIGKEGLDKILKRWGSQYLKKLVIEFILIKVAG